MLGQEIYLVQGKKKKSDEWQNATHTHHETKGGARKSIAWLIRRNKYAYTRVLKYAPVEEVDG